MNINDPHDWTFLDELHGLGRDLARAVEHTQNVFFEISRTFPLLEKKIQGEKEEAEAIINHFLFNLDGDSGSGVSKRFNEQETTLAESAQKIEVILKADQETLDSLFLTIGEIKKIDAYLSRIRDLSKEVKVYAINSIIVSAKSGTSGQGYRALSKFFIQFSNESREQIEDMAGMSRNFFERFGEYENAIQGLESRHRELLQGMQDSVHQSFNDLLGSFREFSRIFHQIFDRVGASRNLISQVMVQLQGQDILHQQVQHVGTAFDILVGDGRGARDSQSGTQNEEDRLRKRARYLDLLAQGCGLNALQMKAAMNSLGQLRASVLSHLAGLLTSLDDIQEDKNLIITYLTKSSAFDNEDSVLDKMFDKTKRLLDGLIERFEESLNGKNVVAHSGSKLGENLDRLNPHFVRFRSMTELFGHMNFIAKKEVAQNDIFHRSQTSMTSDTMDDLSVKMTATLDEAHAFYLKTRKALHEGITRFDKTIDSQEGVIQSVIQSTIASQTTLEQSREVLKTTLINLSNFTNDLRTEVSNAQQKVNLLLEAEAGLGRLAARLEGIASASQEGLAGLRKQLNDPNLSVPVAEFKRLIAVYTVEQERQVAHRLFPTLVTEKGSGTGTIDLF